MITVNIKGGLGNQMFQYACARALALRNNDSLQLVRTEKSVDTSRVFSLVNFDIKGTIVDSFTPAFATKLKELWEQKVLRRFYVGFEPSVMKRTGDTYLDGYFQSERYFIDQAEQIRRDFRLKVTLGSAAEKWVNTIRHDDRAISLHVRRGDYVDHPDFGGIADREYYERAIDFMAKCIAPKFYVFSDDLEWCRRNLPLPQDTTFVSHPSLKDYEELCLMSLCRHNVIANSSFSWWGAWLNPNPNKIVVAPARWSHLHDQTWYSDIIPQSWKRL